VISAICPVTVSLFHSDLGVARHTA
jgi:hypothetical protein